jgi:5-methylcytosine-specific restriction enzyme A
VRKDPKSASRSRNPAWTRDELILALELYVLTPSARGDHEHPATIRLSRELNALPIHSPSSRAPRFRNPNGVGLKLVNFTRFDSAYLGRGRYGMSHGSALDEAVWNEFSSDRARLTHLAASIRSSALLIASISQGSEEFVDSLEAPEGQILTRVHHIRERSATIVAAKRRLELKKRGHIKCEVCAFQFEDAYGALGKGFAECHHTVPLSEYHDHQTTKTSDLALLCANCHRMIHHAQPWLTVNELRVLVDQYRAPA